MLPNGKQPAPVVEVTRPGCPHEPCRAEFSHLGQIWDKSGLIWDNSMTNLGQFWDKSGTILGQVWDKSGTNLRQFLDESSTNMDKPWDKSRTNLGV
jgi:hypothetical protein